MDELIPPDFIRGDANDDGGFNIADAIFILNALFVTGSPEISCKDAADANADGGNNIADAIYVLTALFSMGPPPPAPHPACGAAELMGCDIYNSCP